MDGFELMMGVLIEFCKPRTRSGTIFRRAVIELWESSSQVTSGS